MPYENHTCINQLSDFKNLKLTEIVLILLVTSKNSKCHVRSSQKRSWSARASSYDRSDCIYYYKAAWFIGSRGSQDLHKQLFCRTFAITFVNFSVPWLITEISCCDWRPPYLELISPQVVYTGCHIDFCFVTLFYAIQTFRVHCNIWCRWFFSRNIYGNGCSKPGTKQCFFFGKSLLLSPS